MDIDSPLIKLLPEEAQTVIKDWTPCAKTIGAVTPDFLALLEKSYDGLSVSRLPSHEDMSKLVMGVYALIDENFALRQRVDRLVGEQLLENVRFWAQRTFGPPFNFRTQM